jgi:prevent-host-death family protein
MREIQLREAKSTLSAVVDGVLAIITRHGRREAVIISFGEWERLSRIPSFGRLLMAAPIDPEDPPARNAAPLREVDL